MSVVSGTVGMGQASAAEDNGRKYRSPKRVLVEVFKRSRDAWKRKYMELKVQMKRMRVRVADAMESREMWRNRAEASEAKLAELQAEVERLQAQLSTPPGPEKKTPSTVVRRRPAKHPPTRTRRRGTRAR